MCVMYNVQPVLFGLGLDDNNSPDLVSDSEVLGCLTLSQKNVPSLTVYSFNTHPPIFTIFGTCHQQRFKNLLHVLYNFLK